MKRWFWGVVVALVASCAAPQALRQREAPQPGRAAAAPAPSGAVEEGIASYYASSLEGRATASGEPYRGAEPTCAHKKHRFGILLKVTSLTHGRSVVCRVNDRGPFVRGRVVDLSRSLAEEMDLVDAGLMKVRVEVVER